MTDNPNTIRGEYFDKDFDEVKILPGNHSKDDSQDDSDEEMAQQLGY